MRLLAGVLTLALLGGYAFTANAADYYVAPAPAGNDANAGTSWSAPFLTIQKGINTATAGQTVAVSNGTYILTTQLLLTNGITLLGFGGSSNTIIDANMTGRILSISNSAAVVDGFTLKNGKSTSGNMDGTGVNMTGGTLRNCIVSGCTNTAAGATVRGVGIYMSGGTVDTCVVEKNSGVPSGNNSTLYGGGLYADGASCLVTNCVIEGNSMGQEYATSKGGGVYLSAGRLLASVISSNTVNQGRYTGGGGGVFVTGAGTVSNCTVAANALSCVTATTRGGGLYVDWGTVADCVITNNSCNVNRSAGGGGGVFVSGAGAVLNCLIAGNSVPCVDPTVATGGGGVYVDGGRVVGCVVSNNYSSYYRSSPGTFGGGVRMSGTSLVERCVITRNYLKNLLDGARYGAGVACDGGVMRSCLIMGNTANTAGGGLYITGGTNENCTIVRNDCSGGNYGGVYWTNSPAIVNAIVYNNTGGIENDILPVVNGVSNVTYSCAPSLTSGTGNITADPLFADSGFGSGTNFTAGDYRPVIGGPCAGTGLVAGWMSTALDLAGQSRLRSGQVEMGAYSAVPPVSTYVAESGDDANAGTSWSAPFRTIQKGVNAATSLGTVSVSNGTYVLSSPLTVGKGCTILGVSGSANTVIDANASGRIVSLDHPGAVLDGLTLKNGRSSTTSFNGTGVNMSGGVIRNCVISGCTNTYRYAKGIGVYMVTGTVDTCVIENNDGYGSLGGYGGGGIYMVKGLVTNTVLRSNRGLNYGGAIRMEGGLVTGCAVSNNTVSTGVGGGLDGWAHGGGIYLTAGAVQNCMILQNTNYPYASSPSYGGGVCSVGTGTMVSNCVLIGNIVSLGGYNTPLGQGGGAYVAGGVLTDSQITNNLITAGWGSGKGGGVFVTAAGTVSNCTISGNFANCTDAKTFGGGVYVDWGLVTDCVIANNRSAGYNTTTATYGGGVYMTGTSLVERCVISRNYQVNHYQTSRYGAGVASDGGTMRNCLIMGNTANTLGGGLYITAGTNENCTIVRNDCNGGSYGGVYWTNSPAILNAIVYNNTGGVENNIAPVIAGVSGVTYSCAPSLTSGTGNITTDPLFTASGSGSGTNFTAGDYRLAGRSPCVDKGLTEAWMNTATDLNNLPRVYGSLVDMGAYEDRTPRGTVFTIR
jgi:hypothetical protein